LELWTIGSAFAALHFGVLGDKLTAIDVSTDGHALCIQT